MNSLPESLLSQAVQQSDLHIGSLLGNNLQALWHAGHRLTVETYLQHIPALQQRPEVLLDLIYSEWLLREQFGPRPTLEEYRGRFPGLAEKLGRLLALHAALSHNEVATLEPAPAQPRNGEAHTAPPGVASEPGPLPQTPVDPEATRHGLESSPIDPEATHYTQKALAGEPAFQVPGYEILGELGRGGMGVVYKARQVGLGRLVALKMILSGAHAGREDLERFRTEAEAIARLQHPNIVQVHEVGQHDGKPFFSLEFCTGGSLDRQLDGTPLKPLDAAQLVQTLAQAMQAAHEKNVIHRDLKPANVLLAEDGTPKITDFGLAKKLDAAGQTASGAIMGTPSYMAPEQAGGKSKEIGPAVDVYALGAILYELLTGRPPFKAVTALDTILQVVSDDPVPPRQLQSGTPRDLETICLKCLHKQPGKRYATAAALAEDLKRFQEGRPVQARPVGRVERGWRWCRRNPVVAGLTATVALVLLLGASVGIGLAVWALAEKDRAETSLYVNRITLAQVEWEHGSTQLAWGHLEACPQNLRGWEHDYLATRFNKNTFHAPTRENYHLKSVAFSTDGKRIVSGGVHADGQLNSGYVKVWDLATGAETLTLKGHTGTVYSVSFSPDGKRIVSGGGKINEPGELKVWDANSGTETLTLKGHTNWVNSVSFSPDGKRIVSASIDGAVKVWDADKGTEMRSLKGGGGTSVAFSADGKRIVGSGGGMAVEVWDAERGTETLSLKGHTLPVNCVAISPDGKRIVSGSQDNTVKVWDADKGTEMLSLKGHTDWVNSVAFSPDGKRIVSVSGDKTGKVWDADKGTEIFTLKGHFEPILSVAFSSDGKRIVSGSRDGAVKIWDAFKGTDPLSIKNPIGGFASVAFSPDGKHIVSGSADHKVKVWDADKGTEILTLNGHTGPVHSVAFSPDSKRIVSGAGEGKKPGEVMVWDTDKGTETFSLKGHTDGVTSVAFSPDGKRIVSGSYDTTVKVWDAEKGTETLTLKRHNNGVLSVAFSADGKRIVSGMYCGFSTYGHYGKISGPDGSVKVWDADKGTEILSLNRHTGPVSCVAFSADGRRIVSASYDNTVKVCDAYKGTEILSLQRHTGWIDSVAISPDGKRIVSGSDDNTVKIWDADKGIETLSLSGHTDRVTSVAFSADGKRIVSASGDRFDRNPGQIKVWDADKGTEILGHNTGLLAFFDLYFVRNRPLMCLALGLKFLLELQLVLIWSSVARLSLKRMLWAGLLGNLISLPLVWFVTVWCAFDFGSSGMSLTLFGLAEAAAVIYEGSLYNRLGGAPKISAYAFSFGANALPICMGLLLI